jgi:hypothetical protein
VAFASDRNAFELMVRLTHMMRMEIILMKAADRSALISLWSRFGMTPADRSRVSVEAPKDSALTKFLKHKPQPVPDAA